MPEWVRAPKVEGGTAREDGPPLCGSCHYASIAKGAAINEVVMSCSQFRRTPRFPVRACTAYLNKSHPTLHALAGIAWVLRTDPKREKIGFVSPAKLKPIDRIHFDSD